MRRALSDWIEVCLLEVAESAIWDMLMTLLSLPQMHLI
jgi:hypothetical protein